MLSKQYDWYDDPRVSHIHVEPMPFRGAPGEALENELSHKLSNDPLDGEVVCVNCDVRPWMRSYSWPCGYDVPRVTQIELHTGQVIYDVEYAPGKCVSDLYEDFIGSSIENPWCFDQRPNETNEESNEALANG